VKALRPTGTEGIQILSPVHHSSSAQGSLVLMLSRVAPVGVPPPAAQAPSS
jgi:hypothetical protein